MFPFVPMTNTIPSNTSMVASNQPIPMFGPVETQLTNTTETSSALSPFMSTTNKDDYDILYDDPLLHPSEKSNKNNNNSDDIDLYMDLSALPSTPPTNVIAIPPNNSSQNAFEFTHPSSPGLFASSPMNTFYNVFENPIPTTIPTTTTTTTASTTTTTMNTTNNTSIEEESQKPTEINRMLHILNQLSNLNTNNTSNTQNKMITNRSDPHLHLHDYHKRLDEIHNAQNMIEETKDDQLIDLVTQQASELQDRNLYETNHTIESPIPMEDAIVQYKRPPSTNTTTTSNSGSSSSNIGKRRFDNNNVVMTMKSNTAQELIRNKKITMEDLLNQMIVEKQNHVRQLEEIKQQHEQAMGYQAKRIDELEKQQNEMMKLISELQKLVISNLNVFSNKK